MYIKISNTYTSFLFSFVSSRFGIAMDAKGNNVMVLNLEKMGMYMLRASIGSVSMKVQKKDFSLSSN